MQPLLLTLDEVAHPDLEHGVAPLGPPLPVQPLLLTLDEGYLLTAPPPDLESGVAPLGPPVPVLPLLLTNLYSLLFFLEKWHILI